MSTATNIERYAPGGDIYNQVAEQYGLEGADRVYQAALTNKKGAVADVLAELKHGPKLSESTGGILADQLLTDPFGAPLDSANTRLGNVISSAVSGIFRNPYVLAAVVLGLGFYFWPWIAPRLKAT